MAEMQGATGTCNINQSRRVKNVSKGRRRKKMKNARKSLKRSKKR